MRLIRATNTAVSVAVLPLDPAETYFGNGIIAYGSSTINATAQVDATISDLGANIPVTYSQSTTAITVTFPTANPHTLGGTSDYVTIANTGIAGVDGTWPVASVTSDTVIVLTSTTSQTKSGNAIAIPLRLYQAIIATGAMAATVKIPTVTAANPFYTIPFSALILKTTTYVAGTIYLDVRQTGSGN